ncbi:MAG: class I SAM-dependent rRNA methyltransferase, partial [Chitinispirillaceae bacterium]|nr:class I SAM-dependent rRNA methyltransferase [Chitinispirillaceae bacterium]
FIYERSDTDSRKREEIELKSGTVYGTLPDDILIKENNLLFKADIKEGQKTGFFFDQRSNRLLLKSYAVSKNVCDCFCYTGGFTVYALAGNAVSVDSIDCSNDALLQLKNNIKLNNLDTRKVNTICSDVFRYLREVNKRYDCIILDPPKFAKNPTEVRRAARGYKDINLLACKNILPGGLIFTFSCSNAIDLKLFKQIVFSAAADSGRRFQVLHHLTAGPDHPVNLAHREGEYLKGLVLKAEE